MKIGIIGINEISKFYAVIFSKYDHQVILYEEVSPKNNLTIDKIICEENFFNTYIKDLNIFKSLKYEIINFEVTEKFFIKENNVKNNYIYIKEYLYKEEFNFDKIPNIEIVELNSNSINQIKMMEDVLIIDTPNQDLLMQMNLIKLNNWESLYLQTEKQANNFQITKEGKYSIFGVNEENYMEIFINTKSINKKEVLKIISKKCKSYRILDDQKIQKYDTYAYKNVAIINTALVEYNNPYRDYSLLFQIIHNSENKKIYSNLDIYSDIKSHVI